MAEGQGVKRKPEDDLTPSSSNALVVKKQKTESGAIILSSNKKKEDEEPRTSDLSAPIMLLEGHEVCHPRRYAFHLPRPYPSLSFPLPRRLSLQSFFVFSC